MEEEVKFTYSDTFISHFTELIRERSEEKKFTGHFDLFVC